MAAIKRKTAMKKKTVKKKTVTRRKTAVRKRAAPTGKRESEKRRSKSDTPEPVYFLSLEVENIRCFGPRQKLDLSDENGNPAKWTIVLGDNGFGKSTLLQCLASIQSRKAIYRDSRGGKLEDTGPMLFTRGLIQLMPTLRRVGIEGRCSFNTDLCLGVRLTDLPRNARMHSASIDLVPGDATHKTTVRGEELSAFICYAYGAARRMGATSLAEEHKPDGVLSLFYDHVDLLNPEEWLLRTDYAAKSGKPSDRKRRTQRYLEQVTQCLVDLLPEISDIGIGMSESAERSPRAHFKTKYGWLPLGALGLGYRTVVAWIVDFMSRMFDRYPKSKNPLAEPAIVLVDEIDLHLHPKWQRTIMSYLGERFPNTQFIVTAHSPLVVQAASNANIALLRREGDHVVIDNNPMSIEGWRLDQILTSDLFGLPTARPPELDEPYSRRRKLLKKARLTKKEQKELKDVEQKIIKHPGGESAEQMDAMNIIRRAAKQLKKKG